MNSTGLALAQGYAAVAAFALFLLPPGFLLAHFTNFNRFRQRSPAERLLWSLVFSLPIAIECAAGLGRILPRTAVLALFLALAVLAAAIALRTRPSLPKDKPARLVLLFAALFGLYFVFISTDIEFHHRLFISSVFTDWSVRIDMVASAMRSGVPPLNGLSALSGQPAPLRYFYFWYVLCADLATLLHLPARAALAASCTWASWSLLATFLLALKYLVGITRNLRRHCALAFVALSIMGLDLLPSLRLFLSPSLSPFPEIEWWHQDRTPSLLSATLYAPHHIAAFACLLTGLLVLTLTLRPATPTRPQLAFAALFAGLCFGVAAGTSSLPTLVVACACAVWLVDLLRQRQFPTAIALAASGITALLIARPFLHELQTTSAAAASGSLLHLHWRNTDLVVKNLDRIHALHTHPAVLFPLLILLGTLAINLLDLGFFFFVLIHRIRRDTHRTLTPSERALWAFFLGTSIPYLFLTSQSIASPNDLGVDAGFLLRLLLQLWAVPWLYQLWRERTSPHPLRLSFPMRVAAACLLLGLFTQALQIVWTRIYFPAMGALHKQHEYFTTDHLSERLYNIRQAYRALDRATPPGTLQYNPISPMQAALTLYSPRQIAAFDIGCGTGYGGDYIACKAIMPRLLALYGNTQPGYDRGDNATNRQDAAAPTIATAEDAAALCRDLHLTVLIAESTDSIWSKPTSWVWTMQPIVENPTVRIYPCPKAGNRQ